MPTTATAFPDPLPDTYQGLAEYMATLSQKGLVNPFALRAETMTRIERVTGRPLICYVAQTHNVNPSMPTSIDDSDIVGFSDLVRTSPADAIDVFLVSNGGSPEAAERIVRLLRSSYKEVRFIVPSNAFSAATMISFSGDLIVMALVSCL